MGTLSVARLGRAIRAGNAGNLALQQNLYANGDFVVWQNSVKRCHVKPVPMHCCPVPYRQWTLAGNDRLPLAAWLSVPSELFRCPDIENR